ncbi:hypothetical protein HBO13_29305 [Pseudomonas lactis]|uniref:Uncharacterized protein n=1 Tax=Pseudomonas lactis TaxID=1615674 RepID=A0A7Y1M7P1_9PSED|nr:hypothetical protein [Pseudomonas lactis]NNA76734.1 hypothetical protein [Pseudomonas lactis]
MSKPIPKSKRPLRKSRPGLEWARLYGSFNPGINTKTASEVVYEFLRRAELTSDPDQRLMQAQRVIGALMALLAFSAPGAGFRDLHLDVFARLAALTGETRDSLATMAGVAR